MAMEKFFSVKVSKTTADLFPPAGSKAGSPSLCLQCWLQDSSTVPLRLMLAALRFIPVELRMLMNAHDMATIRFDATTVQAGSATAAARSPTNVQDFAVVMQQVNRDVSDTPIHPKRSRMATIPPTVPPRLSPIPLR